MRSATDIKRHVLDEFVNSEALVTRADDLGYRVSDQELLDGDGAGSRVPSGRQIRLRRTRSRCSRPQGRSIARDRGAVPARREAAAARYGASARRASSTATELKRLRALTRQQRELAWLTLPAAKYAAEATPDDAAIKAYYDAHKSQYMTPETVNLRYVEISLADLAAKVQRRRRAAQGLLRGAEGQDARALRAARAAPRAPHSAAGRRIRRTMRRSRPRPRRS